MIDTFVDCGSISHSLPRTSRSNNSTGYMRIESHQHFCRYNAEDYNWIDDLMSQLRRDFLAENWNQS